MTLSVPPARLTSPTNLSRQEARWRSEVVHVTALDVHVDVTGAVDAGTTGFPVSSTLHLVAHQDVEGLWADFLGESVNTRAVTRRCAWRFLGQGQGKFM